MSKLYVDEIRPKTAGKQVTMPEKPAFSATLSSDFDFTDATWSKVGFDNTEFDIGSNFNTSSNEYTAPVDGIYHFDVFLTFLDATQTASGDYIFVAIYVNGSAEKYLSSLRGAGLNADTAIGGGVTLQLTANDDVSVYVYQDSSSPTLDSGTTRTTFSGFLVG